jgi:hypothetical protein
MSSENPSSPGDLTPDDVDRLIHRFLGLSVDEGLAIYNGLTPAEQAALDAPPLSLSDSWRTMRGAEATEQRNKAAMGDALAGKPSPLSRKMQAALDEAEAKRRGGE